MESLDRTPQSVRRHIAIFGRRNVGKSSLLNALTAQPAAIVSATPGTTTDPVNRAIELHPLGPCLLIDTAGFDDAGEVGELRNERTRRVADQADMALLVTDGNGTLAAEADWLDMLRERDIPTVVVLNKADAITHLPQATERVEIALGEKPVAVSATAGTGLDLLRHALAGVAGDDLPASVTGMLADPGDVVLLVMPQDPQAPRGRLIMPQALTIRDLLDKHCTVVCCTTAGLERSLAALREPPKLIISDSQVLATVALVRPRGTRLTSFSILMAALKGDLETLAQGAQALDTLTPASRVLIAEACTHAPMSEDIGREQIPRLIRSRVGGDVAIDVCAGRSWPDHLAGYDLIVHCGACMLNRRAMLSRVARARAAGVPITNYGLALAHLQGVDM